MPGRSEEMDSRERDKVRHEIAQELCAGIKEKRQACTRMPSRPHKGQSVKQSWDCAQIENEEEDEVEDWQKEDQMEVQWAEDEKLEEVLGRRRTNGSTLQAEVTQRVPELVVHERMSQGEKVKGAKEKKVKGWSTEEMKDKANSFLEEDTEEMRTWRFLYQEEMNQCWKKLAEGTEEEVLQQQRGLQRQRLAVGMEAGTKMPKNTGYQSGEKTCWARIFALFREYNLQRLQRMHGDSKEEEEMKRQERIEDDEGYDEEDQIKRKDGCRTSIVGC